VRRKASGLRADGLEVDVTDPEASAYPTLLFPRVQAVNGNIRAKAMFAKLGHFRDGSG
jgi:hypothetical protein